MQLWQYLFLLTTAGILYMFRALLAPIIRRTINCRRSRMITSDHPTLDGYTGLTPSQLMTNTSCCVYSLFIVLLMMGAKSARNM